MGLLKSNNQINEKTEVNENDFCKAKSELGNHD